MASFQQISPTKPPCPYNNNKRWNKEAWVQQGEQESAFHGVEVNLHSHVVVTPPILSQGGKKRVTKIMLLGGEHKYLLMTSPKMICKHQASKNIYLMQADWKKDYTSIWKTSDVASPDPSCWGMYPLPLYCEGKSSRFRFPGIVKKSWKVILKSQ